MPPPAPVSVLLDPSSVYSLESKVYLETIKSRPNKNVDGGNAHKHAQSTEKHLPGLATVEEIVMGL